MALLQNWAILFSMKNYLNYFFLKHVDKEAIAKNTTSAGVAQI